MINRRDFIKTAAIPLLTTTTFAEKKPEVFAETPEAGPAIKSFSIVRATGSFYRFIGMNAYDKAPKGINGIRPLVKVTLADGTEGIGPIGYREPDEKVLTNLKTLLGKDPLSFYQWQGDLITGVSDTMNSFFFDAHHAWFEGPVLDAIGKVKQKPVWKLFGKEVRNGIDPYDGTLCFDEIAQRGNVQILADIATRIKSDGYRGIKMKLGRPQKWMPGEAGVARDIDAFIAVREAVGRNVVLMADANNGYEKQFDWSVKLLKACAPYSMYFMEELFPDDTIQYQKLRSALLEANAFVPIAEGESVNDLTKFDTYLNDGIYNFLQPDMHTCGFSNILAFARKAESYPQCQVIPHVWQSQLGLIMSLHISKIQKNINHVEDSRYAEHAIMTNEYTFREGQWFIPDRPGWGVVLSPDYKQFITGSEMVVQ